MRAIDLMSTVVAAFVGALLGWILLGSFWAGAAIGVGVQLALRATGVS